MYQFICDDCLLVLQVFHVLFMTFKKHTSKENAERIREETIR